MKKYLIVTCLINLLFISSIHARDLFINRDLLKAQDYKSLELQLQKSNDRYLDGDISLRDYYSSADTLWADNDISAPWLGYALSGWLKDSPESAFAHIYIGKYYADKAYDARGTKWASETSDQQVKEMEKFFRLSEFHIEQGLSKNPLVLRGYLTKLSVLRTTRQHDDRLLLSQRLLLYLNKAPLKIKQTVAVWRWIVDLCTPRWGGSYAEMERLINKVAVENIPAVTNKQIETLNDLIVHDKMSMDVIAGDYVGALKIGEKSLRANTNLVGIYTIAANAAGELKDYKKCYQYAVRATEIRPWHPYGWGKAGFCAYKLQKWPEANAAYRHKIEIDGFTKYPTFQLGVSYMYLHQYGNAYALFKKSEELDPEYVKFTKMYTSYIEKEKPKTVLPDGFDINKLIGRMEYAASE